MTSTQRRQWQHNKHAAAAVAVTQQGTQQPVAAVTQQARNDTTSTWRHDKHAAAATQRVWWQRWWQHDEHVQRQWRWRHDEPHSGGGGDMMRSAAVAAAVMRAAPQAQP